MFPPGGVSSTIIDSAEGRPPELLNTRHRFLSPARRMKQDALVLRRAGIEPTAAPDLRRPTDGAADISVDHRVAGLRLSREVYLTPPNKVRGGVGNVEGCRLCCEEIGKNKCTNFLPIFFDGFWPNFSTNQTKRPNIHAVKIRFEFVSWNSPFVNPPHWNEPHTHPPFTPFSTMWIPFCLLYSCTPHTGGG